jgi:hypothetical protein
MLNIGILTFHLAENYGAALQALALKASLSNLAPDIRVVFVDYMPKKVASPYKLFFYYVSATNAKSRAMALVKIIMQLPFFIKRKLAFRSFRIHYYRLLDTKKIGELEYLVCGSDQIWNPTLTGGIDSKYFGLFKDFGGKTVIYAASDGGQLKEYECTELSALLKNINTISVREKSMIPFIEKYTTKSVNLVLDPVFLPDPSYWRNMSSPINSSGYILVYRLEPNPFIIVDALELARTMGKKIIEITYAFPYKKIIQTNLNIRTAISPNEFVGYFKNADYILTNSFHGTAFSIIFHKQFCVYAIEKRSERIVDLVASLGLQNRYVKRATEVIRQVIDYDMVEGKINIQRAFSINYLKESILGA